MLKIIILLGLIFMNNQANELQYEESPYLQQHASNPVHWFAWGKKALEKAKKENKLIFLSIGYSTCHWCHVMERESFENEKIAELLNSNYISIKVDREEYPNIDKYYQKVYRLMNQRSGGWPLTVVLTPDAKVFFTATYLPPEPEYRTKGLSQILPELYELYTTNPDNVYLMANNISRATTQKDSIEDPLVKIDENLSNLFLEQVTQNYDQLNKGIGTHPKFPRATTIETLLDIARLTLNFDAKTMADDALMAMAKGGINDQIEGGFYRYATDEAWRIPHFEKMLYTNAELLESYANAYKMSGNQYFKKIMDETIANIYTRFEKDNLFYSASDADSDGIEGRYFLFNYEETLKVLKKEGFSQKESEAALAYFNITEDGNFEEEMSNPYLTDKEAPKALEEIKATLFKIRKERNYPFIDNKIQTSWNALFIKALFKASEKERALKAIDALVENLYLKDRLYHQMIIGKTPKVEAYLEDYAFLTAALIDAYEASYEQKYLELAQKLNAQSIKKFYKNRQWLMSDDEFKATADLHDASYRSSMAVSIENILILAHLSDDYDAYELASKMLTAQAKRINKIASSSPYAVRVALMLQNGIVVIKASKEKLLAHKKEIRELYYPYVITKAVKENDFSACTMQKCFSSDIKIEKILQDIESKRF